MWELKVKLIETEKMVVVRGWEVGVTRRCGPKGTDSHKESRFEGTNIQHGEYS